MSFEAPVSRGRYGLRGTRGLQACTPSWGVFAVLGMLALFLVRAPLTWATGTLAGGALGIAMLIQPAIGLAVLALAIPVAGLVPGQFSGANVADFLVAAVAIAWLGRGMAARRVVFMPPPVTVPLLVFVWVAAASLTQAASWREGVPEWLKWAEFAGLYLVATQFLTRRQGWWVLGGLFAAGVLQVLIGAYQFWRQVGPEAFVLMGRFLRAYGTFLQPNPYAGYLGYLTPVALSLALAGLGRWFTARQPKQLWQGLICGVLAITLAAGILMSWSRGGWIALAASALVVVGFRNRRTTVLMVVLLIVLVAIVSIAGTAWLPNAVAARVNDLGSYIFGPDPARTEITDANFSVLERLAHWQAGLQMYGDHPWLGVGIGNYAIAYPRYALPHWYEPLGHAHNAFINFLAETGILGAAAFLAVWLGIAWMAWRAVSAADPNRSAMAIGLIGTLVYLTVHSFFDNLFVQHMQLQLALLAAIVVAMGTGSPANRRGIKGGTQTSSADPETKLR
jgi:putative inorganic carbon (HCO3(-)) transporter